MDIILSIIIIFSALIFSILKGIFIGYPLLLSFLIFAFIAFKRGFSINQIIRMSYKGSKKAFIVLKIFILIGAITGVWMASGTVPSIIYYGIKYLNPNFFILYSFLISCVVSFLLGTSLGTVSTVGIALILIAQSGNVNINVVAGAIMAGAYFGDRCSPMSSSANLVANLTRTELYTNIKNMFRTSMIPFITSIVIYLIISLKQPLNFMESSIHVQLINSFNVNWIMLLPAIVILILSIFKVSVKLSMAISIVLAVILAIEFQGYELMETLKFIILGFKLDINNPLQDIIKGGGVISMAKASVVVSISCALAGIFNETNMLKSVEDILMSAKTRYSLLIYTTIVSIATAALGSNQSIAIVLTNQLMYKSYKDKGVEDHQLALDIENTGVILAALIPWNIAALVPTTTMGVSSAGYIPYAFYLYLIPIFNIVLLKIKQTKEIKALKSTVGI